MTVFSSEYRVGEDERKGGIGYTVAAVLCAVALIALGIVTLFIGRKTAYEMDTVPNFEKAIDEGRYTDALDIYRGIQDEVLKAYPDNQASNAVRVQMLDEMESIDGSLKPFPDTQPSSPGPAPWSRLPSCVSSGARSGVRTVRGAQGPLA